MNKEIDAIVLGASAGGLPIIKDIIRHLRVDTPPLIIVQHLSHLHEPSYIEHLSELGVVRVKEADEKEAILPGTVYLAPGNYHLLIEPDRTFSLSTDDRVNYARPSVNVLFESAAEVYQYRLLGVILSGGNSDGAEGVVRIKAFGGRVYVQDPNTAEVPSMPEAAIRAVTPDLVLDPKGIRNELEKFRITEKDRFR